MTQGLLGGAAALAVSERSDTRWAVAVGVLSGVLADADVLIHSRHDSLLQVEFHRHFSHALVFIPIGALLAASLAWLVRRRRPGFGRIYRYAFVGYAGSGLLDACTSYGTHLLWPFVDQRIAWSIISVVDPVFSLALLVSLVIGLRLERARPARMGLAVAVAYLLLGAWQHENALHGARDLAAQRGHRVQRLIVKPTMANLVLWRSVYLSGDTFYVDAIRVVPGSTRVYAGESVRKLEPERDLPGWVGNGVLAGDVNRFTRFSDGFVALDRTRTGVLIDVRYSMLPTTTAPMWGLDLNDPSESGHARFVHYRDRPDDMIVRFSAMLLGRSLDD